MRGLKRKYNFFRGLMMGLLLCVSAWANAQQERVFGDDVRKAYDAADAMNGRRQYLKAYVAMKNLADEVEATWKRQGGGASVQMMSDADFENCYWPVHKSLGEIAYALGLYAEMEKVSATLKELVRQKYGEAVAEVATDGKDDDTSQVWRLGYLADVAKIDAGRYFLRGQYGAAIGELHKALRWKDYGYMSDFVYKVRDELAQNYYAQGEYKEALAQIDTILASGAFDEHARFQGEVADYYDILSQRALCLARLGQYDEAKKEIEKVVRWRKGRNDRRGWAEALRKEAKIRVLEYDGTGRYDSKIPTLYKEYLSIARNYVDTHFVEMDESQREQYWMAEQPFVTDCYRLEGNAPGMLYDVALFSKAVLLQMGRDFKPNMTQRQRRAALAAIRVDWKAVWNKMPQASVAIEFIAYEKENAAHLGALVLNKKKGGGPVFIDIAPLKTIVGHKLSEALTVEDALAALGGQDKNVLYGDSILPTLIWNPQLVSAIGDSREVYFSADGVFHQLAVEYLLPPSLENKNFYRLTSTRLLAMPRRPFCSDSMLLCGGVDYKSSHDGQTGRDSIENDRRAYVSLAPQNIVLPYLDGSLREVDSISVLRHDEKDCVLRGDSVTETKVRQIMNQFHVLNISTHGYFAEAASSGVDIRPADSDTQLSQSCLFLAGAERNLQNGSFDPSQPDGILSARELAAADLSNVDIVVLSACQSGLGHITIDGVYGLQRGLKTAGVRALVVSLWQIDDRATIQFMLEFYKNMKEGQKLHEAFSQARKTLQTKTVTTSYFRRGRQPLVVTKCYGKPQYYDAFILIDGLE